MSKHNYSQYSNNKKRDNNSEFTSTISAQPVAMEIPEMVVEPIEIPEVKMEPNTVNGVVANCMKLNVRVEPSINSEVVYVLEVKTDVEINLDKSTDEWFYVCTAIGVEGYCMRKFVDTNL